MKPLPYINNSTFHNPDGVLRIFSERVEVHMKTGFKKEHLESGDYNMSIKRTVLYVPAIDH
jgi:hypothetical protein